jgi:hypothetical protein
MLNRRCHLWRLGSAVAWAVVGPVDLHKSAPETVGDALAFGVNRHAKRFVVAAISPTGWAVQAVLPWAKPRPFNDGGPHFSTPQISTAKDGIATIAITLIALTTCQRSARM